MLFSVLAARIKSWYSYGYKNRKVFSFSCKYLKLIVKHAKYTITSNSQSYLLAYVLYNTIYMITHKRGVGITFATWISPRRIAT